MTHVDRGIPTRCAQQLWAAHEVRLHRSGTTHFTHTAAGRLDLGFEASRSAATPAPP